MANQSCSRCVHWAGLKTNDVASCTAPLPLWIEKLIEWEDIDLSGGIAGDMGQDCPTYEARGEWHDQVERDTSEAGHHD